MEKPKERKNITFALSYKLLLREDLSLEAKVLYGIIHNRYNCSLKKENQDRFTDENGETYCILKNDEACKLLNCSQPTATKSFVELEEAGLIERIKMGHNKADLIKLPLGINAIK